MPLSSHVTGLSHVPHGYKVDSDRDGPGFMFMSFAIMIKNMDRYIEIILGLCFGDIGVLIRLLWSVTTLITTQLNMMVLLQ